MEASATSPGYVCIRQENKVEWKTLEDYQYFIVHAFSEFNIYEKSHFLSKYKNLEEIIDLYCINEEEELRYNNGNWVKIFESPTGSVDHNGISLKIEDVDMKHYETKPDSSPLHNENETGSNHDSGRIPLVVYKYLCSIEEEADTEKGTGKFGGEENKPGVVKYNAIQVLYRHGINAKGDAKGDRQGNGKKILCQANLIDLIKA